LPTKNRKQARKSNRTSNQLKACINKFNQQSNAVDSKVEVLKKKMNL